MNAEPVDDHEAEPAATHLEMMLELLVAFDVEYTMIQDEAGTTIEVAGGNRGTHGFGGLVLTYNFGPGSDDTERDEKFLFLGVARL